MAQVLEGERTPRRTEMVAVATRLFSQRGYHGTSMQHLAEALGLQRGSLYAHITSKEDLLFDAANDGAERFLARGRAAAALNQSARARLEAILVAHVETAAEHLDAAAVFLNEWRYLSDGARAVIRAKRDEYEGLVRGVIEDGVRAGEFRPDTDVRFAATLALSAGNWLYAWYRPEGELDARDIGRRFAELLVTGLEAR